MNMAVSVKNLGLRMLVAAMSLFPFVSCDDVIYDYEGDCSVSYHVKFRYDMNLKWADAFANEVKSVHLYAFDGSGMLVWQNSEKVDPALAGDYAMTLDLPSGSYSLIAWCGLDNDGGDESFAVPEMSVGSSGREDLLCSLNRKRDAGTGTAYSDTRLYPLYHGALDVELPADDDGGDYVYTMYLTKDTNHIRVILQHLSGEDVDVDSFTFSIEDENGLMDCDNSVLADENILYRTWNTATGEAGIGRDDAVDSRSIIYVNGAIADLTVGRMMAGHRKQMMLTITNDKGETVASIPLIDYALLAKDYYETEYGHAMSDQEFLDREDEYVLTFFLDENDRWLSSTIMIHSWRIVLNEVGLS